MLKKKKKNQRSQQLQEYHGLGIFGLDVTGLGFELFLSSLVSLSVSLLALFLRCCSRYMSPTSWMYTLHTCLTWGHASNCVPRCVHVRHVSETVKERLLCPCFLGFCVWLTTIFTCLVTLAYQEEERKKLCKSLLRVFSLYPLQISCTSQ